MDTGLGPHGTRCSPRPIARGRPTRRSTRCWRRCHATTSSCAARARDRAFRDQGITFSLSGEERPFPLDLVPADHRRGGVDRDRGGRAPAGAGARALPRRRLRRRARSWPTASCRAGSSPPRSTSTAAVAGIEPPGGVRIHVAGIDLVRDDAGTLPGARGQPAHAVGDLLRRREPPRDDPRVPRAVRQPPHPSRRPTTRSISSRRCATPRPRASTSRASWCSRRVCTTRRTSSTRSWRARWASSWSRAATSCAATSASTCARPRASNASTSSTAASTTTTSILSSSAPTPCSAARAS